MRSAAGRTAARRHRRPVAARPASTAVGRSDGRAGRPGHRSAVAVAAYARHGLAAPDGPFPPPAAAAPAAPSAAPVAASAGLPAVVSSAARRGSDRVRRAAAAILGRFAQRQPLQLRGGLGLLAQGGFQPPLPLVLLLLEALPLLQPAQRLLLLLGLLAESAFLRAQRRQPFRQEWRCSSFSSSMPLARWCNASRSVLACLWDSNTCSDSRP